VRVAPHELLVDRAHDVRDRELARILGDARLEDHLEEQVAELLAELAGVALLDGGDDLVGLLDDVGLERLGGLLAVPGAAAGGAQASHELDEGREPVVAGGLVAGDHDSAILGAVHRGRTTLSVPARGRGPGPSREGS